VRTNSKEVLKEIENDPNLNSLGETFQEIRESLIESELFSADKVKKWKTQLTELIGKYASEYIPFFPIDKYGYISINKERSNIQISDNVYKDSVENKLNGDNESFKTQSLQVGNIGFINFNKTRGRIIYDNINKSIADEENTIKLMDYEKLIKSEVMSHKEGDAIENLDLNGMYEDKCLLGISDYLASTTSRIVEYIASGNFWNIVNQETYVLANLNMATINDRYHCRYLNSFKIVYHKNYNYYSLITKRSSAITSGIIINFLRLNP
jgi:hypothetical protein